MGKIGEQVILFKRKRLPPFVEMVDPQLPGRKCESGSKMFASLEEFA